MKLDFTAAAERAVQLAAELAQRQQRTQFQPVDLLQALIAPEESQAATLLEAAGLSAQRLGQLSPSNPTLPESSASLTSAQADLPREITVRARELARLHGAEGSIASEHLLLAVLEADAALRESLIAAGLDWQELVRSIAPIGEPLHLEEALDLRPLTQTVDLARVLDAAANRAREAARVLEDHARFVLDDPFLVRSLKELRHALTASLADRIPCEARDTPGDVGTALATSAEGQRDSIAAVVAANAKRLQEALRSLEEYGKIHDAALGQVFEKLRYQAYTLEKALLVGGTARARLADVRLYVLVTESLCRASLVGTVSEALAGGAKMIQLREKTLPDRTVLEQAKTLRELTRMAGALLIINDRPDIALLADADGVHLGQDDLPVRAARRILGPDALIGVSTHNLDQVRRGVKDGASYLGVGPTFPSQTKDFADFAGLEFVRQAGAETGLPAFVLGGVTPENLPQIIQAGGRRVAVSHAICAAEHPRNIAAQMMALLGN